MMKKEDKTPQAGSITTGAISGSKKVYVPGKIHDIQVAMREISLTPTKLASGGEEENLPITV
jgi:phosphomethylpyrimidine synthase